jgi:hypothetical protein
VTTNRANVCGHSTSYPLSIDLTRLWRIGRLDHLVPQAINLSSSRRVEPVGLSDRIRDSMQRHTGSEEHEQRYRLDDSSETQAHRGGAEQRSCVGIVGFKPDDRDRRGPLCLSCLCHTRTERANQEPSVVSLWSQRCQN